MQNKIVISGIGIISALGIGVDATLRSLKNKFSPIAPVKYLKTTRNDILVGEVPFTNSELLGKASLPESYLITRSALLGLISSIEAIENAALSPNDSFAFINATTVGGMDVSEQKLGDYFYSENINPWAYLHCCGAQTNSIVNTLERKGYKIDYSDVVSTACSAAANAIALGADLIKSGKQSIVVAGGTECLTNYHLLGFDSLMILSKEPCSPFDNHRSGLNLGEGGAFLVLESEQSAKKRGITPLAVLSGYGNACDAFHPSATSDNGEGPYLSMLRALKMSGIKNDDITYINAHGTATPNNDLTEGIAIERIFKNKIPFVTSTKGATGHTTSAAGGVEAVISVISLINNFIPATLNFKSKIDQLRFTPIVDNINISVENILSNSFGFGGNDTSLIFSKYSPQESNINSWIDESNIRSNEIFIDSISSIFDDSVDYKNYISPLLGRRLSPVIKKSIVTSKRSLSQANISSPDAIITATSLASVSSTYEYNYAIANDKDYLISPANFISSTPNAIGTQVAIALKCHSYNTTHADDCKSFESALVESFILLNSSDHFISNVLLNVADESPDYCKPVLAKYMKVPLNQIGDGVISFVLSKNRNDGSLCKIVDIQSIRAPKENTLPLFINEFLQKNNYKVGDISICKSQSSIPLNGDNVCDIEDKSLLYMTASGNLFRYVVENLSSPTLFVSSADLHSYLLVLLEK